MLREKSKLQKDMYIQRAMCVMFSRLLPGRTVMTNLDSILKSRDITLPTKVHLIKAMVFPVLMYGCESWTVKKAECRRIDAFELRCLESPWDWKEIQPVHPEGDQSWVFTGRTDAEAKPPIFWPPDVKNWLTEKDLGAGKNWGQEEKGTDDGGWDCWMASPTQWTWIWINCGSGDGQGDLACCSPWGRKESHDSATKLNWMLSHVQLCGLIDCNLPGSSVHGILQTGILEWVTPFPPPGDLTQTQGSNPALCFPKASLIFCCQWSLSGHLKP